MFTIYYLIAFRLCVNSNWNILLPFSLLWSFQGWSDLDGNDDEVEGIKEEGVGCLDFLLQNGANVDLSSVCKNNFFVLCIFMILLDLSVIPIIRIPLHQHL